VIETPFAWGVGFTGHEVGNFKGYQTANEELRHGLLAAGGRDDPSSDVCVHFCFPSLFVPQPGKKNILFTMYENKNDPRGMRAVFEPRMALADLVVTPSRFCADLLAEWTSTPVALCPLGVDSETFAYRPRRWDGRRPFVWLYCGALNRRKFTLIDELWTALTDPAKTDTLHGRVLLYIKTTGLDLGVRRAVEVLSGGEVDVFSPPEGEVAVCRREGVVIDNRRLPKAALAEVYWSAHGSLFLHCGEGWGMTGLEGMSTGLPLVVSDYSGTQEYADSTVAFPVPMRHARFDVRADLPGSEPEVYDGPWPNAEAAVAAIGQVMSEYPRALGVARAGAERAKGLSWLRAGERLAEIIRRARNGEATV